MMMRATALAVSVPAPHLLVRRGEVTSWVPMVRVRASSEAGVEGGARSWERRFRCVINS